MGSEAVSANTIDVNRHDIADSGAVLRRGNMHRLQIGRTADKLARMPPRTIQQEGELAPHARRVEALLLGFEQALQGSEALRLDGFGHLVGAVSRPRAGPWGVFE
jgi:hypothetical protein